MNLRRETASRNREAQSFRSGNQHHQVTFGGRRHAAHPLARAAGMPNFLSDCVGAPQGCWTLVPSARYPSPSSKARSL